MNHLKQFWQEEEGIATVEILLILAVLIAIALIFKDKITELVTNLLDSLFGNASDFVENTSTE